MELDKQESSGNDNKRAKLGKRFVAVGPPRNEYTGFHPRCGKCFAYHPEGGPCRLCYNCQKPCHFARDCRALVRKVVPINAMKIKSNQRTSYECGSPDHFRNTCPKLNRAPGQVGNHLTIEGSRNPRNNRNQARGRVFNVNAIDAFFISSKCMPLLNVKPSIVKHGYVIEVGDGKNVEIDRIICGCKLELGNSLFTIDLIPLGHGSFDVIIGMDWLSRHKAEIVCHEKVVGIPLANREVIRVRGERASENSKTLMSTKVDEHKLGDILIIRDFPEVFSKDLNGLPPQRQVKVYIVLVPRAMPVTKSPYRLAPSEMQELSEQLQELINDLFDQLQGSRYFSKIDLRSGYHQLRVHEEDISKTAIRMRYGHFEFMVTLWVNQCTSGFHGLDELVLELLKKEKLFAKFSKCEFWLQEVYFLRHMFNSNRIHVDPSKIEAVKNWRRSECTIQTLEDMLRACMIDFGGSWDTHLSLAEFSYNNSYHSIIRCAPFEALYERRCRSPVLWTEIGENWLIRPELVQETTDKVKGVMRFEKKGKLAPRYVGPFEILERMGHVAYRLRFPQELSGVHDMFHVSNLKKCLADGNLHVPLGKVKVDKTLRFIEEPVEIMDREIKKLKCSRIPIVNVHWNSKRGPEFTWEREDL
nr:hypothetical protein [Tanacetum cinerariifolium]